MIPSDEVQADKAQVPVKFSEQYFQGMDAAIAAAPVIYVGFSPAEMNGPRMIPTDNQRAAFEPMARIVSPNVCLDRDKWGGYCSGTTRTLFDFFLLAQKHFQEPRP